MGRIFVIIGGLLVLLLTAALVIPPFVNWSGYRTQFEQEASRILGRPVHVAGDVSARLLPFPSVVFSDVRVGGDAAKPDMTIAKFSMDAELMPFLRGQVLIFDMRVDNPQATITLDKDGRVDWAIRPVTPVSASQIKVERLSVNNGRVKLQDMKSGRTHQAENINAVMSATSLAGPWQANGTMAVDGHKLNLDVSTGEAKPEGLNVRLRLTPETVPAVFDTDGLVEVQDGRLTYAGRFGLRSADANQPAGSNKKDPKQTNERPFLSDLRLNGDFTATRGRFELTEFRMEQGPIDSPYLVNGKALINLEEAPRFDISAEGQQIFWGAAETEEKEQSNSQMASSERLAILRRVLEQLPIPTIPGNIDLRLPAVIAGGTTIRSVTVSAEPAATGWKIRQFQADLPGRTRVEASGLLGVGQQFGFDGNLLVASRQPSGLAAWLDKDVDEAVRRLPSAGLSGQLKLKDGIQRIENMEIALGDTSLKGSFLREVKGVAQPSTTVKLEGGKITSDALQAAIALLARAEPGNAIQTQALNVELKAGQVFYDELEAANVDLAMRINDRRFDFDRFMVSDFAGATFTATGALEPFSSNPSSSLDATVLSDDLSNFFTTMSNRFPQYPLLRALSQRADNLPGLFADTNLNVIVNAAGPQRADEPSKTPQTGKSNRTVTTTPAKPVTGNEFSFTVAGTTGDMKLDLAGTAINAADDGEPMQIQLNGSASSDQGEYVLALIGLPALPLGIAGELTADINLQGSLGSGMRTQLTVTAPDGKASVDGVISLAGGDIAASGKAVLKSADIQPFIATTGFALPGFGDGLRVDMTSDFQFAKGIVRLPNLAGKINDEDLSSRLEANFSDSDLPMIKGEAKLASLELDSLAAIMLGQDALEPAAPTKKTVWPRAAFAARSSLPVQIDMKLTAAQATTGNFGNVKDVTTRIQKTSDTLKVTEFTGNWAGGFLQGGVTIQNSDKNAILSSDIKWKGANLKDFYQPEGYAPFAGEVQATVNVNGSGSNIAELMTSLAGSAAIDVKAFTVNGLDSASFSPILASADAMIDKPAEERGKLDAKAFEALAQQAIGNGQFVAGDRRFEFTIAGGIARMAPAILNDGKAELASDLQFDLSTFGLGGAGSFTFLSQNASQTVQSPKMDFSLGGTFDTPTVQFDKQPLTQFLTQHTLEREQQRVEAMQASLIERQQLRRQLALFTEENAERERSQIEEEKRRRDQSAARVKAEQAAAAAAAAARAEADRAKAEAENNETLPGINPQAGQSLNDFVKELQQVPAPAPIQ